jgi:hypothetical protein
MGKSAAELFMISSLIARRGVSFFGWDLSAIEAEVEPRHIVNTFLARFDRN